MANRFFTEEPKVADTETDAQNFLSVYTAITGIVVPVISRRNLLLEYKFKYDVQKKVWKADKQSVYEQLLRNFKFDDEKYPDFNSLLDNSKGISKKIRPVKAKSSDKIFTPPDVYAYEHKQRNDKIKSTVLMENPYIKKTSTTTPCETNDNKKDLFNRQIKTDAKKGKQGMSKRLEKRWTNEEIAILTDTSYTDEEKAQKLGRSLQSIKHKKRRTGLAETFSETKSNARKNAHSYTYEDNKLIIEAKESNEKLAERIGVTATQIRVQRNNLRYRGVSTIADLDQKEAKKKNSIIQNTQKTEDDVKQPLTDNSESEKGTDEETVSVKETITKETSDDTTTPAFSRINSLVDRTMDLMSEFESLSKEFAGKERQLRTKARYEQLLKTLINKDLQFFALTTGDDKIKAQNKYLKSIGFTDIEIKHFRGEDDHE